MTEEEYHNLQPDQEVFLIKKVMIKDHRTFTSGVERHAIREKASFATNSYLHEKNGNYYWKIKGAKGNKNANRSLMLMDKDKWFLNRDEALAYKVKAMIKAVKNCKAPSVRSQPEFKLNRILKQKVVLLLTETYPEVFI